MLIAKRSLVFILSYLFIFLNLESQSILRTRLRGENLSPIYNLISRKKIFLSKDSVEFQREEKFFVPSYSVGLSLQKFHWKG